MNLCALTMRTTSNVRDDRPFSGPVKNYVPQFKGLKGSRNSSVTYRSNFFPEDDLDDPELSFHNNSSFRNERDALFIASVFSIVMKIQNHSKRQQRIL